MKKRPICHSVNLVVVFAELWGVIPPQYKDPFPHNLQLSLLLHLYAHESFHFAKLVLWIFRQGYFHKCRSFISQACECEIQMNDLLDLVS